MSEPQGSGSSVPGAPGGSSWDLVRHGTGDHAFNYDIARFDGTEEPFERGRAPFFVFKEVEQISDDEGDAKEEGEVRRRPTRRGVRWTLQDSLAEKSEHGLVYHGRAQAQAQGSAYVLMAQSRENRRVLHVMPLTGWVAYERVANAVDVPSSIKEAEMLMKKKGKVGSGAAAKKRKGDKDEDPDDTKHLSKRQRIERLLLKSLKQDDDEGPKKGKGKGGGGGAGRRPEYLLKAGREEAGAALEEAMLGDLAQAEDTRELLGMGGDGEENEDEYEFQDDEEDLADVNNYLLKEQLNNEEEKDEEPEEEEEEEEDDGAHLWDEAALAGLPLGDDDEEEEELLNQQQALQAPPASQPPPAPAPAAAAVAKRKQPGAGGGGAPEAKRARLTSIEAGSLAAAVRERLVGLGGRVKWRELMPALKDLVKDKEQVQAVKDVLAQIAMRETDPVDQQLIFTIRPEFAKR